MNSIYGHVRNRSISVITDGNGSDKDHDLFDDVVVVVAAGRLAATSSLTVFKLFAFLATFGPFAFAFAFIATFGSFAFLATFSTFLAACLVATSGTAARLGGLVSTSGTLFAARLGGLVSLGTFLAACLVAAFGFGGLDVLATLGSGTLFTGQPDRSCAHVLKRANKHAKGHTCDKVWDV